MEKVKSAKIKLFIFAVIYSVLFAASVPGLILSAVNSITALMIICIVIVAVGFYTLPVVWIKFAEICTVYKVVNMIYGEQIFEADQIAAQLQIDVKTVCASIRTAVHNGYLKNYLFDGNILKPNDKKRALSAKKCPNCGANLKEGGEKYFCPYCGFEVSDK